jgi:ribonuclease R
MSNTKKKAQQRDLLITGTIRMHARGFGFVIPDKSFSYDQDVFIPKQKTGLAVDGDKVEVEVSSIVSEKGPEGKVLAILERSRTHLAGTIRVMDFEGDAEVYVPVLGENHPVVIKQAKQQGLAKGDRIVMKVTDWGDKLTPPRATLSHRVGSILDPSTDVQAAIEEFDIRHVFPQEAIDEAKTYGGMIREIDLVGRVDLTEVETITIDPDTAKDFDDALSLKKRRGGGYELMIHIADVSYYVKPGTVLDEEARKRCNSTYFPGKCIPMLPEALSNELCSLNPHVPRLAATIKMVLNKSGELMEYGIFRSLIKSDYRFSYREAKAVIDGKPNPHTKVLNDMVELCLLFKAKRKSRGSVDLTVPEMVILVNEKGEPTGIDKVEYDISHQLVEEFMLKANEMVAKHLASINKDLTYRIHDKPDEDNIKEFVRLARAFGHKLPADPSPDDFQNFFVAIHDTPYYSFMVTHYIRSMKMAIYSPENIGHYGLSLEYYCHFTSPIRRYADLVVHRILFGHQTELQALEEISELASEKERISAKAEQSVVLLKKLRHIDKIVTDDPEATFPALITRIRPFGFVFELLNYEIEGFINLSDVDSDFYVYEESKEVLIGRHTSALFSIGTKIDVFLKSHDLVLMEVKWGLVEKKRESNHKKGEGKPEKPKKDKNRRSRRKRK